MNRAVLIEFSDNDEIFPTSYRIYSYLFDADGNLTSKTAGEYGEETVSYSYDGAGRLTGEYHSDGIDATDSWTYTYDRAGNRDGMTRWFVTGFDDDNGVYIRSSLSTYYIYNKKNQLTAETAGNTTTVYGYDANGNRIGKYGGDFETYTYDPKNRLIKLTGDWDWDYAFYSYRPDGLRREKTIT